MSESEAKQIKKRFDGYLPVVVDVETSGVDSVKNALLEVAAAYVDYDAEGKLVVQEETYTTHVNPFEGARIDDEALKINNIDPYHPFRFAIDEEQAITELFDYATKALKATGCRRALLVGHNAYFDLSFVNAAMKRSKIKRSPFHAFTVFDTATIGGVFFGKTILAKALKQAAIPFDKNEAHAALYDTLKTAELFCQAVNSLPASVESV
jgi:ribonuclease T